jgi:hypothetical protein
MRASEELSHLWTVSQMLQTSWGGWSLAPPDLLRSPVDSVQVSSQESLDRVTGQLINAVRCNPWKVKNIEAIAELAGEQIEACLSEIISRNVIDKPQPGYGPNKSSCDGGSIPSLFNIDRMERSIAWLLKQGDFGDVNHDSGTAIILNSLVKHMEYISELRSTTAVIPMKHEGAYEPGR